MTLHWWMHWFWVTLIHSVVTFPLLLPGTLSAPSQEGLHGIQSSVSSPPPITGGGASWKPKTVISGGEEGFVATEKAATDNVSSPMLQIDHGGLPYVSPEGSVAGKEGVAGGKDNASESNTEVPLFLEKEDERIWGLDDTAPRPPFFLQSAGLGELYEEEEDGDEGIHASAGMPWPPASVPRVEISSPSERPSIVPSHESPSSTVEPWPANKSLDHSSADAVHAREGKAIGVSHVDQQPKQEQKQVEVTGGSEVALSTTVSPTKVVESSPVKSSSNSNATAVIVGREDEDVKNENVTLDSSGPVKDVPSSNSDKKVVEVEEAGDAHLPPVVEEEKTKNDDKKDVVGGRNESGSINVDSSVVDKDGSNIEKSTKEEEITAPVEVPTAVAVREGSASVHSDVKKEQDGEVQASEKDDKDSIMAAADVPSSVHQGRMTAPRSLDTASIVGISLGSVLLVGAVAGGVGFVLYRRSLYANKPQTLNDKCSNPDSSGYIDDTLRVSSANRGQRPMPRSRVEMTRNGGQGKRGGGRGGGAEGGKERRQSEAKENSEEMYSLDNDSFLNSLEAMTIQNYWTDSVKHTKL